MTGFHNAISWTDRLNILQKWRSIASEYPHLNLTIYEDFAGNFSNSFITNILNTLRIRRPGRYNPLINLFYNMFSCCQFLPLQCKLLLLLWFVWLLC